MLELLLASRIKRGTPLRNALTVTELDGLYWNNGDTPQFSIRIANKELDGLYPPNTLPNIDPVSAMRYKSLASSEVMRTALASSGKIDKNLW